MTTTIFNTYTNPYIINAIYGGSYEVVALSDSNYDGIDISGNAQVTVNPIPVSEFDYTANNLVVSFLNTSRDGAFYHWNFGDGNSSNEINPVHTYENSGEYVISLTVSNGFCGDSTISKNIVLKAVSAGAINFNNLIKLYPNPTNGLINMEINNPDQSEMKVEIVSISGRKIYSNTFHSVTLVEQVDLSSHSNGMYLVKISSREFFDVKKLILSNVNKQ